MIGNYPELERLSPQEKLVLAGELLHQAAEPDGSDAVPDAELLRLLEERLEHFRQHPETALSWDEVKRKVRGESPAFLDLRQAPEKLREILRSRGVH